MSKKKEKKIDLNNLEPGEKLKYEVAEELGLLDRVLENGWKSLTSISYIEGNRAHRRDRYQKEKTGETVKLYN